MDERVSNIRSILDKIGSDLAKDQRKQNTWQLRADDPKEPARRTVKSACIAAEQRYHRSRSNPRHVWEAIHMCTHPDVAPMMLPFWCTAYLHQVANGLLAAEGDGDKLAALIAREIGFTKRGWSAVKDSASRSRATAAALLYDRLRFAGNTTVEAYEMVRENEGFADEVSARKLVRRGKAMLSHIPSQDAIDD